MTYDDAIKPTVSGLVDSGFNAILLAINTNAENGQSTDIYGMVVKLRQYILTSCGYDYPIKELADLFEVWMASRPRLVMA